MASFNYIKVKLLTPYPLDATRLAPPPSPLPAHAVLGPGPPPATPRSPLTCRRGSGGPGPASAGWRRTRSARPGPPGPWAPPWRPAPRPPLPFRGTAPAACAPPAPAPSRAPPPGPGRCCAWGCGPRGSAGTRGGGSMEEESRGPERFMDVYAAPQSFHAVGSEIYTYLRLFLLKSTAFFATKLQECT